MIKYNGIYRSRKFVHKNAMYPMAFLCGNQLYMPFSLGLGERQEKEGKTTVVFFFNGWPS